jgi:hypothetical protein
MSDTVKVRKVMTVVEEIHHEGGPPVEIPIRRGAIMAVIANPFAGRYEPDVQPMMEELKPLGLELSQRLIAALGGDPAAICSYGKGAIVGAGGEAEHGALWHVPGGYAMREALGGALAIVPSAAKVGGVGSAIDIPISHKDASYVRSHFDAMDVRVPDGPRADEIVFILVMATGGRVHARMGGLQADEIVARDGLR